MDRFVSIPRKALANLLETAGVPLTPEEYLASLPEERTYKRYPGRAKAAALSKSILIVAALLSGVWVCTPWGFGLEDLIIAIGLGAVTFFEYRLHRYFREMDPRAPDLGFKNQSAFAAAILIYGLFHALVQHQFSADELAMIEQSNLVDADMIRNMTRIFYLVIGVVGGVSQFGLAWYYRSARIA